VPGRIQGWRILIVLAVLLAGMKAGLRADERGVAIPHGTVALVSEQQSIQPGQAFLVGVHFRLESGWHIYWINPGDSGEPPRLDWHLPSGLRAGAIEWPAPRRLPIPPLVDYGYEGEVLLPVPIEDTAGLAVGKAVTLAVDIKAIVCREVCMPAKAQLTLLLPVSAERVRESAEAAALFRAAKKTLPKPAPASWRAVAKDLGDSFELTVPTGQTTSQAWFAPLEPQQIENATPQKTASTMKGIRLILKKSDQLLKPVLRLRGVLVLPEEAYLIDAPVISSPAKRPIRSNEMKRGFGSIVTLVITASSITALAARVGEPAPHFAATDSNGKIQSLSSYRGKFVVLEWHNQGCPYTQKHYNSGNMERLQKEWTQKGVVWFTVISSAPGTQGYVTAAQENDYLRRMNAAPTAALLDPMGDLGHLYSAKTTPHMFIINPDGVLIYDGAIDDKPTPDQADIPTSRNYVSLALSEAMSGKPVSTPTSRPYGCSVKYTH